MLRLLGTFGGSTVTDKEQELSQINIGSECQFLMEWSGEPNGSELLGIKIIGESDVMKDFTQRTEDRVFWSETELHEKLQAELTAQDKAILESAFETLRVWKQNRGIPFDIPETRTLNPASHTAAAPDVAA